MSHQSKPRGVPLRKGNQADRQLRARGIPGILERMLPLIHATSVGKAREIIKSRKLETRHCASLNKRLLYFFALRPAYSLKGGDEKTHQINRFPFIFVVDPAAIEIPYHVYPMDTGGAINGTFGDQIDYDVFLEDYELESSHKAVTSHIAWAFKTLRAYFAGDLRSDILDDVPQFETVTRGYVDIARLARSDSNQPDRRASSIEVATDQDVPLRGNVKLVILPKQYLEDDGRINVDFMECLRVEGIAWKTYDWQPNAKPNEFQDQIVRIVESWARRERYF